MTTDCSSQLLVAPTDKCCVTHVQCKTHPTSQSDTQTDSSVCADSMTSIAQLIRSDKSIPGHEGMSWLKTHNSLTQGHTYIIYVVQLSSPRALANIAHPPSPFPSILWYCWLGLLTCKTVKLSTHSLAPSCLKALVRSQWKSISELLVSLAMGDHTVLLATRHKRTHSALTPASKAGTRFTYPGGMEGWVDLGALITPAPEIKPMITRLEPTP